MLLIKQIAWYDKTNIHTKNYSILTRLLTISSWLVCLSSSFLGARVPSLTLHLFAIISFNSLTRRLLKTGTSLLRNGWRSRPFGGARNTTADCLLFGGAMTRCRGAGIRPLDLRYLLKEISSKLMLISVTWYEDTSQPGGRWCLEARGEESLLSPPRGLLLHSAGLGSGDQSLYESCSSLGQLDNQSFWSLCYSDLR